MQEKSPEAQVARQVASMSLLLCPWALLDVALTGVDWGGEAKLCSLRRGAGTTGGWLLPCM